MSVTSMRRFYTEMVECSAFAHKDRKGHPNCDGLTFHKKAFRSIKNKRFTNLLYHLLSSYRFCSLERSLE